MTADSPPLRLAVIATIYRYRSHAQHFTDRFLVGYPREGRWHRPNTRVASLYVDQRPVDDQSADRAREFGFAVYPTIAGCLRCGGDRVSEADGRAVPVYNDKHLSYNFEKAREMVDDSHRLGFPLLAGSSLPVT